MLNLYQWVADPFSANFGVDINVWQFSVGLEINIREQRFSAFINLGPFMGDFEIGFLEDEDADAS